MANMGYEAALQEKARIDAKLDRKFAQEIKKDTKDRVSYCFNGELCSRFDDRMFPVRKMV